MKTKRFTDANQIIAAIDKCHTMAHEKLAEADKLEKKSRAIYKRLYDAGAVWSASERGSAFVDADELMEQSKKLRRAAANLIDKKSKKLGEKLAEFRTRAVVPLNGQLGLGDMSVEGI